MKKTLLTLFLALFFTASYATNIISVTKSCGGLLGYSYVHWHREVMETLENGNIKYGWVGDCNGRGFQGCKPPAAVNNLNENLDPIEADAYDQSVAYDLITQIELNINSSNTSGNETVIKVVDGQFFKRIYTVTWNAVPITCQDENGNDISSFSTTYNCSVDYVAL